MKNVLDASFSCSLKEAIGKHNLVAFNVGPSGEVYVLLAVKELDYRTKDSGFASFAKIVPDSPQRYRVLAFRQGDLELDIGIDGERFNIHTIQPLGNDLLLACSRSEYRGQNDFDLNGRVYSRDGIFLREFLLGDGLETIQTTRPAMRGKGFVPTAIVQTAPGRYQAWIKLSEESVPEDVREHAINGLKRAFGVQSAGPERMGHGRLAGFTCGATGSTQERARRFVLLRRAGGAVAKQATAYMQGIRKVIDVRSIQHSEISWEMLKSVPKDRGRSR